jgi:hypothetical protein
MYEKYGATDCKVNPVCREGEERERKGEREKREREAGERRYLIIYSGHKPVTARTL